VTSLAKAYCSCNGICIPSAAKPCRPSSMELNVVTLLKTSAENEALFYFKMNFLFQLSLDFSTIDSSFLLDSRPVLTMHVAKSLSAPLIHVCLYILALWMDTVLLERPVFSLADLDCLHRNCIYCSGFLNILQNKRNKPSSDCFLFWIPQPFLHSRLVCSYISLSCYKQNSSFKVLSSLPMFFLRFWCDCQVIIQDL
jgi:hypothetical protein